MVCRSALKTGMVEQSGENQRFLFAEALTIGSGSRATFPAQYGDGYSSISTSAFVSQVFRLDLSKIISSNTLLDHPVKPGLLGTMTHNSGLKTAVVDDCKDRALGENAALITTDSYGIVDFYNLAGPGVVSNVSYPYGVHSDPGKMMQSLQLANSSSLITMQFTDLFRAKQYSQYCMPSMDSLHLSRARSELNVLIRLLRNYVINRTNCQLMILGLPAGDGADQLENRLQPIMLTGDRIQSGTLYSASTRRTGVVLDIDYLPTVAAYLELDTQMKHYGRPIENRTGIDTTNPLNKFRDSHTNLINIARVQNKLGGLPTLQMFLVIAGLLAIFYRKGINWIRSTGIAIAALPLGMLVLPPMAQGNFLYSSLLLFQFTTMCAGLGWDSSSSSVRAHVVLNTICSALLVVILGDLMSGSHLLKQAWMSYSVVEGARFYGIGNEYMGVVLGAGCVLINAARGVNNKNSLIPSDSRDKTGAMNGVSIVKICFGVVLLMLIVVMGAPQLGAKVGAVPTAIIGFGVAMAAAMGCRMNAKKGLLLIGAIILVLLFNILLDSRQTGSGQSHFIRALYGGGVESLWSIWFRKLSLEARLLITSPWSLTMALTAIAFQWLTSNVQNHHQNSFIHRSFTVGIWVSAVAALIFNDSGVTAAAMIFLLGWAALVVCCPIPETQ